MLTITSDKAGIGQINRPHWTVHANYRYRAGSFALTFVVIALHLWNKNNSLMTWGLLALQFLVYPPLVFWRARRAQNSQQAEVNNLVLDTFFMGAWMAFIQFPLWISFALWLTCSNNLAISRGSKGIALALLAFSSGVLISVAVFGFRLTPATELTVTLICMAVMSGYLLTIGKAAYGRSRQLRKTREQLRLGEQKLNATNEALQQQLIEIQSLQAKLNEQAVRDPLTGLYNRRFLDTIATRELVRCEREASHLSIMMIDIDHFKNVNDTYGHQGGDEILKKLATLLLEKVRASDVACRYGGEEFLILLPNMPPDIARSRADHWRAAFEAMTVPFGGFQMHATLSIGIATYPQHGESVEELTRRADQALYRAKSQGRNQVVLFDKG